MSLHQPLGLLVVLVLPFGWVVWLWLRRRPVRYAVRYTNVDVLAGVDGGGRSWRRLLPAVLFVLALVAASVALARPYRRVLVPFERRTMMLVVDVSGSMAATDIRPSRIGAARQAARSFLARLPRTIRVGVLAFSAEPEPVTPPTSDRRLVAQAIDSLTPGGGTAIGDALTAALRLGERTVAVPKSGSTRGLLSILLLSDGTQNGGQARPLQAARLARAAGVPVYTVALGSPRGAWLYAEAGRLRIAPPDTRTLHAIATTTGGQFTNATNASTLRRAYTRLGRQLGWEPGHEEIGSLFLAGSAALLAAAWVLGSHWAPRLP